MAAWGREYKACGKVRMLADTRGEFTKAIEIELDLTETLGNVRCQRFSLIVEDGKVSRVHTEPDGIGLTCSLAEYIFISHPDLAFLVHYN